MRFTAAIMPVAPMPGKRAPLSVGIRFCARSTNVRPGSMAEPSVSEGDAADGVRAEAEAVRAAADRLLAELARLR